MVNNFSTLLCFLTTTKYYSLLKHNKMKTMKTQQILKSKPLSKLVTLVPTLYITMLVRLTRKYVRESSREESA